MTISHIDSASCVSLVTNTVLSLQNILYVPTLNKNLLSVSKFANDNNIFFEFYSYFCYVKHQVTKQILFQGIIKDGLYVFHALRSSPYYANYTSFKFEKPALQLWHNRLGHYSFNVVKNILNQCNITCNAKPVFCDACVQVKTHKLHFSSSMIVYTLPLQLTYIDIWDRFYACYE